MDQNNLRQKAYNWVLSFATDEGLNASGQDEIYGCIFGRDSAISILKILHSHTKQPALGLLEICRRGLLTLINLQGKEFNLESGEEPGKFIHEFRKERYEHLINKPNYWFIYQDNTLRNYDSIDSTGLTLIALYKYWQITQDNEFLITALPAVEQGLNWIITFGDKDHDHLIEYELPKSRKHGGLVVQSWTDSHEALRQASGEFPPYPIAPVEAQAISWLALKLWGDFYRNQAAKFANKILKEADALKESFNRHFIIHDQGHYFAAQALDGYNRKISTVTGNPLICLWAAYQKDGQAESVIDSSFIGDIVARSFLPDLFDPSAGIRTMSTLSPTFNPNRDSYHNGSFWPVLNGLAHEGLLNFKFANKAGILKEATLRPIQYFDSPIELYIKGEGGEYQEFLSSSGQVGCRHQAWSAATALDLVS